MCRGIYDLSKAAFKSPSVPLSKGGIRSSEQELTPLGKEGKGRFWAEWFGE